MKQEEIFEYNKRCAEFLGYTFKNHDNLPNAFWDIPFGKTYSQTKDLEFHSDWNWIMEMLDKVALLDFGWKVTSKYVNIYSHTGDPRGEFDCTHSINCPENVMLDTVRTINQFLIWYNNVNTNK